MNVKEGNNTHDNYVYHAAKNVRNSLLNHKADMPWPPYATDLKDENILLPNSVYNLFTWIHNDYHSPYGKDGKFDIKDPSVKRLVQSFGQDLLYTVSKGRQNVPKHVALPLTVEKPYLEQRVNNVA